MRSSSGEEAAPKKLASGLTARRAPMQQPRGGGGLQCPGRGGSERAHSAPGWGYRPHRRLRGFMQAADVS